VLRAILCVIYICVRWKAKVSQQFAECISLPDHASVQVRVVSNVPKATMVTIEPHGEDDWEVLELNSEQAEAAILNQVHFLHSVNLSWRPVKPQIIPLLWLVF
jgi:hypothetical protein